jgi:carbamoyl-phosphate synthase small subunit
MTGSTHLPRLLCNPRPAHLVLRDGTIFSGYAAGAEAVIEGEVVFNTSMTGYQEMLTDPSYHGQILTLTTPIPPTTARS